MSNKVLVVDDQPDIRKLVSVTLSGRGYEVIEASGGEEALDKARFEKPDLVVLDIMMPGMDGIEVRDRMSKDKDMSKIPILFLTARGDFEGQLDTLESGPGHYLTKPFKPSELADYVHAMLDPALRGQLERVRSQQMSKLRTVVEIMREKRDQG